MPRDRRTQPASAAPGQPYGARQRQLEGQRDAPLPQQPSPGADPVAALQGMDIQPMGPLDRPSERPDEPFAAGLPVGPGPGPEELPPVDTLAEDDPDLVMLAAYLPTLEFLSSRPSSTVALRNLTRRLRAMVPPDFDYEQLFSGPQWNAEEEGEGMLDIEDLE